MNLPKKPTIYDIKYATLSNDPYFFSHGALKAFGQTMKSFSVYRTDDPRVFGINAAMYMGQKRIGITNRYFYLDKLFHTIDDAIAYADEKESAHS